MTYDCFTAQIERCENCKYIKPCKRIVDGKWEWFDVCTVFNDEEDPFLLVVEDDEICEMWSAKR